MAPRSVVVARMLALAVPAALMAGALGSQYLGGLHPCEMCHWQRLPHYAAIALAAVAFMVPQPTGARVAVALAALAILTSGAIGVFHAGVEYHWWQGITGCTSTLQSGGGTPDEVLTRILNAPIVRCDAPQWTLFGISLAGYNALFSLLGGGVILALTVGGSKR